MVVEFMTRTVEEVMTRDPITVAPETPLQEAIQIIVERKVSGLPVVDTEGKLVGIISESDLMWQETGVDTPPYVMILDSIIYLKNPRRYEEEVHKALGQTVGEVMTHKSLITITPQQSLKDAARLMHDQKIRRLPVLDDQGKVIGIITQGDVIRTMANS